MIDYSVVEDTCTVKEYTPFETLNWNMAIRRFLAFVARTQEQKINLE